MNIISMIPTDEWEAFYLAAGHYDPRFKTAGLIRKPLVGWAHTDDPHRPVVGLTVEYILGSTVDYMDYFYAAIPGFNGSLVGYVHCSEGDEVLQRYREGARRNLHRPRRQAPRGSSIGRLVALHPAPGWSAVYFDYHTGDSLSTMPPLVRKPLVGWGQYRYMDDELVGLVVLDTSDPSEIGIGDMSLLAGYFSRSQPLETQQEQIKNHWDAYVMEVTSRSEESPDPEI